MSYIIPQVGDKFYSCRMSNSMHIFNDDEPTCCKNHSPSCTTNIHTVISIEQSGQHIICSPSISDKNTEGRCNISWIRELLPKEIKPVKSRFELIDV